MKTFDPKNQKSRPGFDRRDRQPEDSFNRDDSRSSDRDEPASMFSRDKRPRISRPAPDHHKEGEGDRKSFNPNFTRDNRKKDEGGFHKKSYSRDGDNSSRYNSDAPRRNNDAPEKSWNREDRPAKPWNKEDRPAKPWQKDGERSAKPWNKDGDRNNSRSEGAPRPWNKDGERPAKPWQKDGERSAKPWNKDGDRNNSRSEGAPRPWNKDGERPAKPWNREDRPAKPWNKDGDRNNSRSEGAPRPWNKDGERPAKPWQKDGERSAKPWNKDGDRNNSRPEGAPRPWNKDGERPAKSWNREDRPAKPWNKEGGYNDRKSGRGPARKNGFKTYDKDNYPRFDAPKTVGAIRLNRFIANSGVCSRREADDLITAGLVSVNGKIITELGSKVNPTDEVRFNDSIIRGEKKVYILMNKPKGYVTSLEDPHADKTVMDLLKGACSERVYPVGRLDKSSVGVLLVTNDGELTRQLTHPSYNKRKVYQVSLDKSVALADLEKIAEGITLEDGPIQADEVSYVADNKKEIGIEIHSGRNRIVRRIFESLGYAVQKLDRVYFAGLTKKNLKRGAWRFLTPQEVSMLKSGEYE